jgi:hypothetical protein
MTPSFLSYTFVHFTLCIKKVKTKNDTFDKNIFYQNKDKLKDVGWIVVDYY